MYGSGGGGCLEESKKYVRRRSYSYICEAKNNNTIKKLTYDEFLQEHKWEEKSGKRKKNKEQRGCII